MNNNEDFLKAIKSAKGKKSTQLIGFFERESEPVADMIIDNITLKGKSIEFISFTNCRFNGCQFDRVSFENCQFIDCSFVSCLIDYSEFDVTALWNCSFLESSINEGTFRNAVITKVSFKKCRITQSRFIYSGFSDTFIHECALISVSIDGILAFGSTIFELPEAPLNFRQTQLFRCTFTYFDFIRCQFEDCSINASIFCNIIFGEKTFSGKTKTLDGQYSSIDLQSLRNSTDIPFEILENVFGIHAPDIQSYAREMLSKMEFYTVFISYSFRDSTFAELINNALLSKGVFTFLWKNDAPGGARLKQIMYDRIQSFDKVLFIASKNSLKSEACHFELSEGKKKYESTWEEVLFPVHIDDYLFKIQKHDIPRAHRDLFYDNILELREIHSKDFSNFATASLNNPEFDKAINNLITDLRKKH